jgi:polyketide biosynthesis enoyl-CoA hydratase PksI
VSVTLSPPEDGIGWIELRDDAGTNGLAPALIGELVGALAAMGSDPSVRVVLLSGTPQWFCSGATRETLRDVQSHRRPPAELHLAREVLAVPVPVIAAVEGDTLGGGLALMLATDLQIVARQSRHAANFMALGITPGMGITHLLARAFGPALADELLYTGRSVRGDALPPGAVNRVVDRSDVRTTARDLAWRIADKDRDNLRLLKRTLSLPRRRALEEAMTCESLMHESSLRRWDERQMG